MLTVLIDYESGNLHSAHKAFERMAREENAGEVLVSGRAEDVARADRIVLPGDGAFPHCRAELSSKSGLEAALREAVEDKARPFMGICIGMQMMASKGLEHTETTGFGWVPGTVRPITPAAGQKVPHMGWNDLVLNGAAHPVLEGIASGDHAYFVHSYQVEVDDPAQRLATVDYGAPVTAIIGRDNMIGAQFHPEKSQKAGLRMIANFLKWAP
ncbi:imidazole glycerol phosphate synthase subunit HisH [Alphaproteobacteria bacterium KMM 3653]|uniref:Imidazole glycerol phosphate synthase subunit HisH n=1 Tax=Harenicola maris TaxID=2841044 RepID=A0AAP2G6V6_9RHOB|nr:imidazole glycerol phosphate synthase subunit HisH [Harenicola maris]